MTKKATNDTPIMRTLLGDDFFNTPSKSKMRKKRRPVPKPSRDPAMKIL